MSLSSAAVLLHRGVESFLSYYSRSDQEDKVETILGLFESDMSTELLAEEVSKVWAPELDIRDDEVLQKWQLQGLSPNSQPFEPTEVVLQLNALYTLPEETGEMLIPPGDEELSRSLRREPGEKVADYDHPVPLYAPNKEHELVACLEELDLDIDFEKEMGVLPQGYRMPVLLSISVTHATLDEPAGCWVEWLLREQNYSNLRVIVLTETRVKELRRIMAGGDDETAEKLGVFSVFGKYGRHFNALKYSQLLLEKLWGIKAGFKLDTDEGLRSRELYEATGQTWLQTLCHPYWGGTATDANGEQVLLAVNEGEYINSSDIERNGYAGSLRSPDVTIPNSWKGGNMFFQKAFAHGRATALYNRFDRVEEGISHPVVKGGGYGISNEGLRRAVPFTFSWVGRAEDQQFYFSCLPKGVRGIFHPNLRIAHYKGTVKKAEERTAASRFLGDMYRLIIFRELVDILGVKGELDPMPGVFAGELAWAQAAFALALKSLEFFARGNSVAGEFLLNEGAAELVDLEDRIRSGEVRREFEREREMWRFFIQKVAGVNAERLKKILNLE
ncbi:MAG TPA: hypothetical protein ENN41_11165 [Sediminispirochaeta sp.]|nr:hypothetical protein [Sediminispirochaeta sp.]